MRYYLALQGKKILTVGDITVSELSQLQKENITQYHLYEAPRIAKFIQEIHRIPQARDGVRSRVSVFMRKELCGGWW